MLICLFKSFFSFLFDKKSRVPNEMFATEVTNAAKRWLGGSIVASLNMLSKLFWQLLTKCMLRCSKTGCILRCWETTVARSEWSESWEVQPKSLGHVAVNFWAQIFWESSPFPNRTKETWLLHDSWHHSLNWWESRDKCPCHQHFSAFDEVHDCSCEAHWCNVVATADHVWSAPWTVCPSLAFWTLSMHQPRSQMQEWLVVPMVCISMAVGGSASLVICRGSTPLRTHSFQISWLLKKPMVMPPLLVPVLYVNGSVDLRHLRPNLFYSEMSLCVRP